VRSCLETVLFTAVESFGIPPWYLGESSKRVPQSERRNVMVRSIRANSQLFGSPETSAFLGHVTRHHGQISATPVEKSVGIGCRLRGRHTPLRMF
jgi:hypothetical protein